MNENILPFSKIIINAFDEVKNERAYIKKTINIYDEWKKIIKELKVKSVDSVLLNDEDERENLSYHSRVVDLKAGILFIEVDHPGWIEFLNIHKYPILIKLRKKFPETDFKTLAFFLKS